MLKLQPAFQFDGNCAEAMSFYATVFGGSVEVAMTWGNSSMSASIPQGYEDKIMHTSMRFGDALIMGSDALPGRYSSGSAVTISVALYAVDEGKRIFDALASGGVVIMPFQEMFWAKGFGQVTDKFGIPWMVNCEEPN